MKTNEIKIFIFIASIIVGLLISLNLSFNSKSTAIIVNAQQYQKLVSTRYELQKELMNLKQQRNDNRKKVAVYQNNTSSVVAKEMEKELEYTRLLLGTSEATGEGIKISIKDHSYDYGNSIEGGQWTDANIIHAEDLMEIIKTLRNFGAKAISLNGFRLTANSSLICSGQFIAMDKIKLPAPYYIEAIGNKDSLYKLMQENGFIQVLRKQRHINVFVDAADKILMPAYVGDINSSYLADVSTQ
ncbi:DUF881 domain-containing protein [Clostridium thermarum]|uniref:DUF881 domain-containing protein n=1 Tax=Clostridium thermarum TaxID=1716543 RepID=UPI00112426E0|nr:DUF881 domain-containing protein [Clostridium thermarum]